MNIFVAKLSPNTTSEDLQDLFGRFGTVVSAKVIFDRETGNSKGYGFVEMSDETEGNDAIENLHESEFDDAEIVVKKARPKEEGAPRGGGFNRGGGGGGGFKPRTGGYSGGGGGDRNRGGGSGERSEYRKRY